MALMVDTYCVSNIKQQDGSYLLRIVDDGKPLRGAKPVSPNLDEVFLHTFFQPSEGQIWVFSIWRPEKASCGAIHWLRWRCSYVWIRSKSSRTITPERYGPLRPIQAECRQATTPSMSGSKAPLQRKPYASSRQSTSGWTLWRQMEHIAGSRRRRLTAAISLATTICSTVTSIPTWSTVSSIPLIWRRFWPRRKKIWLSIKRAVTQRERQKMPTFSITMQAKRFLRFICMMAGKLYCPMTFPIYWSCFYSFWR